MKKSQKFLVLLALLFPLLACSNTSKGGGGHVDPPDPPDPPEPPKVHHIVPTSPVDNGLLSLAGDDITEFVENYTFALSDQYVKDYDHYQAKESATLTWDVEEDANYYLVELSSSEDLTNSSVYLTNDESVEIDGLLPGKYYYWRVNAYYDTKIIQSYTFTFETRGIPQTIYLDTVKNLRDLGGMVTSDNKRIKDGMVFRGANPDGVSQEDKDYMLNTLGIKTEIELRNAGEGQLNRLGVENCIRISDNGGLYYDTDPNGISHASGRAALLKELRLFADESNYPIYFHCAIGRDRTGSLAAVLLSLLGVSKKDMCIDYEMSMFALASTADIRSGLCTALDLVNQLFTIYNYIYGGYTGATMKEKTEAFLLDIGMTQQEINSIRSILLEDRQMRKKIIASLLFVSLISCASFKVVDANDYTEFAFTDIAVGDYNRGAIQYELTSRGIKYSPASPSTSTDAYMRFEDFSSLGLVSVSEHKYLAVRYRANFDPELIFRVKSTTGLQYWNDFFFTFERGASINNTMGTWSTYVFNLNFENAKNINQTTYNNWAEGDYKGLSINIHNYNGLRNLGAYLYVSSFAFFSTLEEAQSYGGLDYASSLDTAGPVITTAFDSDTYHTTAGHPIDLSAVAYDEYDDTSENITGVLSNGALDEQDKLVEGEHTITYSATDLTGNTSTKVVNLIVAEADTVAPVIDCEINTIYVLTGTYNRLKFTAVDDIDGEIECNYEYSEGSLDEKGRFNEGRHTLVVTASDLTGNVARKEITIIASDDINPEGLEFIQDEK